MTERHGGVADQGRRELLGGELRAEIAERQRIPAGVRDDIGDDRGIDVSIQRRTQNGRCRFGVEAGQREAWDARQGTEHAVVIAGGEDERDRLGRQPAGDETEHLERLAVQMVSVIDHADRRNVVARTSEDRQHPESDERTLGRSARSQAGGDEHRVSLGGWDVVDVASERTREPLHGPERERRLDLVSRDPHQTNVAEARECRLDEGRLADARVAVDEQCAARAVASTHDQRAESFKLVRAPEYPIESCYGPQTSGYATVGISPTFQTVSNLGTRR